MKKVLIFLSVIIVGACTNANSRQKKDVDTNQQKAATYLDNKQAQQIRKAEEEKQAQVDDTVRKPLPIPKYKILTTDSVWATPASLKPGKPVMIVYFSPDCSHCQKMMY